jgi:multiple sugar transport system substrate-binding protein
MKDHRSTGPLSIANRPIERRTLLKVGLGSALALPASSAWRRSTYAQEQVGITLTTSFASPEERAAYEALVAQFESLFPNIDVDYQPVPSDYDTKLQADLAAGNAADVFALTDILAPDLMSRGVLQPIDDLLAQSGVATSDFYPGLIANFQYNGQTFGLPKDFSTLAMVWDPVATEAAGIAAAPASWDELRAAGQALADAGQPPIVVGPQFDRYLAFHFAAGATVISEDGSAIEINSEAAAQALEFFYGLYRDGISQSPADVGASWAGDAFTKGLGSIVFEGPWMFGALQSAAPDKEFQVSEMPAGPAGKSTLAFTVAYCLNAQTFADDPARGQAAWELVNYLTGPEGMAAWTKAAVLMPSRPALADQFLTDFPQFEAFLSSGEFAHGFAMGPGGAKFNSDANAEIEALFAEQQDVATTLENLQSRAEETITLTPGGATPAA